MLPCDVSSDQQIADVITAVDREFGGLDFLVHGVAFAPQAELSNPFVQTSRDGFRIALEVSAYSLIALTRAVAPLMERRGGGSILTLTYLGSQRVFTNYNVMGVAKAALESIGPLSGERSRSAEHPRQRHFRRTDQDAGGCRHLGLLEHPAGLSRPGTAPPQCRARRGG